MKGTGVPHVTKNGSDMNRADEASLDLLCINTLRTLSIDARSDFRRRARSCRRTSASMSITSSPPHGNNWPCTRPRPELKP